jgi:hypothetical protein
MLFGAELFRQSLPRISRADDQNSHVTPCKVNGYHPLCAPLDLLNEGFGLTITNIKQSRIIGHERLRLQEKTGYAEITAGNFGAFPLVSRGFKPDKKADADPVYPSVKSRSA